VSRSQKPSRQVAVDEQIQVVLAVLKGELSLAEAARRHKGPCFRGGTFAEAFTGDDPLLRHVRTRIRSPQTNGVVERFFGTLKYEHLYRAIIGDGNALTVELGLFRRTYNTLRPHQALDDRTPRQAYVTGTGAQ
jgi:putative transposase